ncbi:phage tail tape measure protein [Rhodococcus sp. IEGM 1330]|uniref:phage tail tape measure protein n=1 Tax=Rhodococcus sp. IEGM 1330 TaxID=3082225 RepID=UPI0029556487|nr:phage tail tape measure protein [Rhodococcus sp. IEGM 1330]MDV8022009.1 phage tail tape measure protein [Rhodococcus sp. IEGM 1330]
MAGGRIEIEVGADLSALNSEVQSGADHAADVLGGIGAKVAGALAVAGAGLSFASVIETGNEFTRTLNSLSGVTGATAAEMETLKAKSMELGNDVDLSATSANDAASAMLELSKGGFTVEQSMEAAKGTLQLAAAAQIDAAEAATIQSQALQAFGLDASYAATASDVLANAANASSAEITDIASGLAQSGAVANQFGLSIEDTSATLGMLANAGITGSDAGTLLKSTLLSLTDTSKPAQGAMETLGLTVYDTQGQFVGMESLIGQLQTASQNLTPELYQQATATLLGSDAMRLGGVAAEQGAAGFNSMRAAVGEQGAAAALAAAQNQGLPGVFERMGNTSERLQLQLYDLIDGPLTSLGTTVVDLADGALDKFDGVVANAQTSMTGLGGTLTGVALSDFPMLESAWSSLSSSGESLVGIASTAGSALVDLGEGALVSGGLLDTLQAAGQGASAGLSGTLNVIEPLANGLGSLVGVFTALPGPIQSAAVALVALRVAQSVFSSQIGTVQGRVRGYSDSLRGAVRSVNDMRAAAANQGVALTRVGSAMAVLSHQQGAIGAMATSYRGVADNTQRYAGALGTAAAAGKGLQLAAGGLFSALGGPAGIAITAAVVGLSLYAKNQRDAAQATAEHKAAVDGLVQNLDAETGALTQAGIKANAEALAKDGYIDKMKGAAFTAQEFVQATAGSVPELEKVNTALRSQAQAALEGSSPFKVRADALKEMGISTDDLTRALMGDLDAQGRVNGALDTHNKTSGEGTIRLKDFAAGLGESGTNAVDLSLKLGSMNADLTEAEKQVQQTVEALAEGPQKTRDFAASIITLGDSASSSDAKINALKQALDYLHGGTLNLDTAQRNLAEANDRVAAGFKAAEDGTSEFGGAIIGLGGAIDTSTASGRALFDATQNQADAALRAAQAAFQNASANGDLAAGQVAASATIQTARDSIIAQAEAAGYGADRARELADRLNLVPGNVSSLISVDADEANRIINDITKPKTVSVNFAVENPGAVSAAIREAEQATGRHINRGQFADGGPIVGGTPGKDSVPILAMPGEHMLTTDDVDRLGGQEGVYRFREALSRGSVKGYATGGAIDGVTAAQQYVQGMDGMEYVVGSRDCSFVVSAAQSVAMGGEPKRLYTTYSLLDGMTAGLVAGGSPSDLFVVGTSQEHMSATVGGINIESGGAGGGVQYGRTAVGAFDPQFTSLYHLPLELISPPVSGDSPATAVDGYSYSGTSKKATWAEKDQIALDRAVVAVQQAKESRDKTFANGKKTEADRQQAVLKITAAEQKVKDLEAKKEAAAKGLDTPPAPQAPELTTNYTDDELSRLDLEAAVVEANRKRNEVYAASDPESTPEEKADADRALQRARNALTKSKSGGSSGTGAFTTADQWSAALGEIVGAAVTENGGDVLGYYGADNMGVVGKLAMVGLNAAMNPPEMQISPEEAQTQLPVTPGAPNWIDEFMKAMNPKLFDTGGEWKSGTLGVNMSGFSELVLTNDQRKYLESERNMIASMANARGKAGSGAGEPTTDPFASQRPIKIDVNGYDRRELKAGVRAAQVQDHFNSLAVRVQG